MFGRRTGISTKDPRCRIFIISLSHRNVLQMGRHELARKRRKSPVVLAALIAPAAVFFAAAGDVGPPTARDAQLVVGDGAPCCLQIVDAAAFSSEMPDSAANISLAASELGRASRASRWRVDNRVLPVGLAPEQGLQVRTILASRSISATFPQIHEIGGVRPDPLPWHPLGLALDVMIPNPDSPEGIELGNRIVAYVLQNAERFGMQDAIWRGVYYTPTGSQASRLGHYDHVHVTTTGGGYPKGGEIYLR
jgi:hypothetical protein